MSVNLDAKPFVRRVLLLEDETLTRLLLTELLTKAGFEVCATANSKSALLEFERFDPNVLIADINLDDGTSGLDLLSSLMRQHKHLAGVVLSNYAISPDARDPELKEIAYLRKRDLIDTTILLDTLDAVLTNSLSKEKSTNSQTSTLDSLTHNQLEVLKLIAAGLTNQEIANRRGSTLRATEQVVNRIFTELGLSANPATNPRVLAARIYIATLGMPEARP
jgi:DNA-binding NarL/FixJ family response regulator